MATVNPTYEPAGGTGERLPAGTIVLTWTPLTTTNTDGAWVLLPNYPDKTVQVYGTFGAAATVVLQGSNETGAPSNPITLTDQSDNAISKTAAGIELVAQNPLKIRPLLASGGDGSTAITVKLVCRATLR